MVVRWGTTCFKCQIAFNIIPFLLYEILVRIRIVIAKSQIFRRVWCRQLQCVGQSALQMTNLGFWLCDWIWRWSPLCLLNKIIIGWVVFWFPVNHGNDEEHFGRTIYPSHVKPHTRYTTNVTSSNLSSSLLHIQNRAHTISLRTG